MKNPCYFFLFFLIFAHPIQSGEFIDLTTLINYRTEQYRLKDDNHTIYLFTPVRTGSTLIFNILRFLFENEPTCDHLKIIKAHHIEADHANRQYIVTVRNPIDACFSHYRILHPAMKEMDIRKMIYDIVELQMEFWQMIDQLMFYNKKLILLRYEDFVDNIDYVFDRIEVEFSIFINEQDKNLLRRALSKQNVVENIRKFSSFDEYDQYSLFHGDHIDKSEISELEKEIIRCMIIENLKKYEPRVIKWGYSLPRGLRD